MASSGHCINNIIHSAVVVSKFKLRGMKQKERGYAKVNAIIMSHNKLIIPSISYGC